MLGGYDVGNVGFMVRGWAQRVGPMVHLAKSFQKLKTNNQNQRKILDFVVLLRLRWGADRKINWGSFSGIGTFALLYSMYKQKVTGVCKMYFIQKLESVTVGIGIGIGIG